MTADSFVDAIRCNPEDEALRLAWAVTLEQQGQRERAEFVRVQCELARLLPEAPAWQTLAERQDNVPEGAEDFVGSARDWHAQDWGQVTVPAVRRYTTHRLVPWPVADESVRR